ncbi:SusC/RagA family TonB-linked outer membrane protein [Lacibacter sp. MH-610]|uniref:SusC/RagA family TonB-linked outer membrane protein n=1 Tax=Lacibacter sp. MH-610 TaxID=3020883 RepID=UPI003891C3D1
MRKKLSLLVGVLVLFTQLALAQTVDVSGKVTDDKGNPLPNASVLERGTSNGTTTNSSGEFKLSVKRNATIEISSVGFNKQVMSVGSGGTFNIQMVNASESLAEVVVTASGIRREKKALGYAVATVDKKQLELRPEGDPMRLLQGKAPGVNILNSSGISGSGTNITIRGVSSLTGGSQPLFVVDGVPFDGSTNQQGSFLYGNQTGSRFFDLDPNNIESINVLKGLSATTLYGSLGRNGVVLITTKNGSVSRRERKKTEITVNQSVFMNQVANLPEYTTKYGNGFNNAVGNFFSNWSAIAFTDPPMRLPHPYDRPALRGAFPELVGAKYDYKFYPSVKDFFRTGVISNTSVNIAGGGPGAAFNANYSNLNDQGFTPGNTVSRNSFGVGGNVKLTNKFTLNASANFVTSDFKTPPTASSTGSGSDNGVSVFGDLIYTPTSVDLMNWPYQNPADGSSVYYRAGNDITNPRWTVANSRVQQITNRAYGNVQLRFDALKNLNFTYKIGFDNYSEQHIHKHNKGGVELPLGFYRTVSASRAIWDHSLIGNYSTKFGEDFTLNVDGGLNAYINNYKQFGQYSSQQLVFDLFDHSNFIQQAKTGESGADLDFREEQMLLGAFAFASVGYKDYLYLNVGARNDWSSKFESDNRQKLYPNVTASFIPTAAIEALQNSKVLNYLKIRAGYSTSASFGSAYQTRAVLGIQANRFLTQGGTTVNSNTLAGRRPNPDLLPELSKEVEVGVESKMFNNRLNIDLTLYRRRNPNQILDKDLDPSSGFTVQSINAATVENKGIELGLGYTIIRRKNLVWDVNTNFTLNRNRAYDFPAEIQQIGLAGYSDLGIFAFPNKPLGLIYGSKVQRDPSKGNQPVVDGNGNYIVDPTLGVIGDVNPDFQISGITNLSYKGFSFRMQWDYSRGGDMFAMTPLILLSRGVTKDTEIDRQQMYVIPGVNQQGQPNNVQITVSDVFFNNRLVSADEFGVWDATVIRLREMSLSYALPESVLNKTPFGGISLTISGQNLWYNAPAFPKYTNFDPETSTLGVSSYARGFELMTAPSSRRIGASIRITF